LTPLVPRTSISNLVARRSHRAGSGAVAGAAALLAAACGGSPLARPVAPLAPPRQATAEEVLSAYDAYCRGLETLSASGDLEVRDSRTGKSQRVGVRLVAARGGRLYLKGSVAVVTALEVVANGDRFWLQVPSRKTIWTGPAALAPAREAGSSEAPYFALRPSDVTRALLPEPLAAEAGDALVLESDRQAFALLLARPGDGLARARRRVWLSRETLQPLRSREYDERGELVSEATFGGYREGLPREVVVSRPAEGYVAAFSLDRADRNVTVPDKAFIPRLPEGYKVVEVQ
jgi:outer membrane lipoprotein-sorting protein